MHITLYIFDIYNQVKNKILKFQYKEFIKTFKNISIRDAESKRRR